MPDMCGWSGVDDIILESANDYCSGVSLPHCFEYPMLASRSLKFRPEDTAFNLRHFHPSQLSDYSRSPVNGSVKCHYTRHPRI